MKALIVNASLSKFGRNLELVLPSSVNFGITSSVVVSGVHVIVVSQYSNYITLNIRNESILNSNLSNLAIFDKLNIEISPDCFPFNDERYCVTLVDFANLRFECLISFECSELVIFHLKIGDVIAIDGLILQIWFVDETTFDVILPQEFVSVRNFELGSSLGREFNLNLLRSTRDML